MASSSLQSPASSATLELRPLSAADYKIYNQMSETMDIYHTHFRETWKMLHNACTSGGRPQNMVLREFLQEGLQFCKLLTIHHGLEEQHLFPVLATKMPEFQTPSQRKRSGVKNADGGAKELIRQHQVIHEGMDGFEAYLQSILGGENELDLRKMKEQMDSWGGVLWQHFDEEVETLGAENMRRYWTVDDMRRMAF